MNIMLIILVISVSALLIYFFSVPEQRRSEALGILISGVLLINLFFILPQWYKPPVYNVNDNRFPIWDFSFNSAIFIIKWGIPLLIIIFIQKIFSRKIPKQVFKVIIMPTVILLILLVASWTEPILTGHGTILSNLIKTTDYILLIIIFMTVVYLRYRAEYVLEKELKNALSVLSFIFLIPFILGFMLSVFLSGQISDSRDFMLLYINLCILIFNLAVIIWLKKYSKHIRIKPLTETNAEQNSLKNIGMKYGISKREMEVLELVCQGKSNTEIADTLFISVGTVKDHNHSIYSKTDVKNRTQLVRLILNSLQNNITAQ